MIIGKGLNTARVGVIQRYFSVNLGNSALNLTEINGD